MFTALDLRTIPTNPPDQVRLENIHLGRRKLSRRHFTFEQKVELGECTSGRLGHAEIGKDDTEEARPCPKETGKVVPVPRGGVDHGWREDVYDDGGDIVGCAAELIVSDVLLIRLGMKGRKMGSGRRGGQDAQRNYG